MPSRSQSSFFYLDSAWRTMKSHSAAFLATVAITVLISLALLNFNFLFAALLPVPSAQIGRIARPLCAFFLLTTLFLPIHFFRSLHTQKRLRPLHDTALFFKHYHRFSAITLIFFLIAASARFAPFAFVNLCRESESGFLLIVLVILSLVCAILPFLFLLHFSLTFLLVFDPPRKNIFHLMATSRAMMRGNRLTLFCIFFIVSILAAIVSTLFDRIPATGDFLLLKTIPFTILNILLIAWFILAWIAFYEDLKETAP